jgi:hypothetical protein
MAGSLDDDKEGIGRAANFRFWIFDFGLKKISGLNLTLADLQPAIISG